MPSSAPRYRRVLLKLSGEGLMGDREYGLDPKMVGMVAQEVRAVAQMGVEVCLVIGGGNIFRGVSAAASGMDRASGDYMGMLATVINSLAMQSALERQGMQTRVQSAIPMTTVCEPYIRRQAPCPPYGKRPGRDLRGRHRQSVFHDRYRRSRCAPSEMGCRRAVEGAPRSMASMTADPKLKDPNAKRFETADLHGRAGRMTFKVMDASAISLGT